MKEIDSLKRKFNYVSGNQQFITRETFKKNIGYLGIRSVSSFLDRMFNSFDIDEDNKVILSQKSRRFPLKTLSNIWRSSKMEQMIKKLKFPLI